MKHSAFFTIIFLIPLFVLAQTDLQVDGNLQLNRSRSTIFFQGDYASGHRGGIQFLTSNNGSTFIFQPTDASGIAVNSTLRLGGFGTFSSNTINLAVSGNVGIGTTAPAHKLQMNGGTFQIVNPGVSSSYYFIFRDEESANSSYFFHRKTDNYQILGSNKNGTGSLRKIGFAIGGGDNESDVKMTLDQNGNLGIGTQNPNQKLTVNGTIYGKEVKVDLSVPGPDYVFEKDYNLLSLAEIETYIRQNKHLPEVPAAKEMEQNGINLGEMNMLLLKKVEELTLHLIEQEKKMDLMKKEIEAIKNN